MLTHVPIKASTYFPLFRIFKKIVHLIGVIDVVKQQLGLINSMHICIARCNDATIFQAHTLLVRVLVISPFVADAERAGVHDQDRFRPLGSPTLDYRR